MHQTQLPAKGLALRNDLVVRRDRFEARVVTVFDRIANRIVRLTAADWQRLQYPRDVNGTDQSLWQQSHQAGLLNKRRALVGLHHAWQTLNPLRLLVIRVPLLSIDGISQILAKHSDWLFSPLSIMLGVMLYVGMLGSVAIGWDQASLSLQELISQKQSIAGLGVSSLVVFIAIKLVHELAHAVACRRSGAAVGNLGLIFFLGMPSPYCDVSTIAANDSRWSRAAVMAAGVYVEMVMAAFATAVWWMTAINHSAWLHLICFQVMLISGISTLLFNANPLMKLDGYFVLSDILNIANLRQQAAIATRTLIQTADVSSLLMQGAIRNYGLAIYHGLSIAYRASVLIAIALFLLSVFAEWRLAWLGLTIGVSMVILMMVRLTTGLVKVLRGDGSWNDVALSRRLTWSLLTPLALLLIAMWPLTRELNTVGVVDVIDAQTVYAYEAGTVDQVCREYGDSVGTGEPLVKLRNDEVRLQTAAVLNEKSVAAMESNFLSRRALQREQTAVSWELDQAKRDLLETQLVSLQRREQQLVLSAPMSGVVLPPAIIMPFPSQADGSLDGLSRLSEQVGMAVPRQTAWCRVGNPASVAVYVRLSAAQRQLLQVGSPVEILLDAGRVTRFPGAITSIEEWLQSANARLRASEFVARCEIAQKPSVDGHEANLLPLGAMVECRLHIENERVWQRLVRSLRELLTTTLAAS